MEICDICNKKIGLMQTSTLMGKTLMHTFCIERYEADPAKYGGKEKKELTPSEEDQNKERKSRGSVITDIDLPWGRVFWVSFQFLVVGLILAIPVWILVMILFAIAS